MDSFGERRGEEQKEFADVLQNCSPFHHVDRPPFCGSNGVQACLIHPEPRNTTIPG